MADASVRPTSTEDVAAVVGVAERGWRRAYGDVLSERAIEAAMSEWYDPDRTHEAVDRDDVSFLVAERGGDVVGFVGVRPSDEERIVTLGAIYVEPGYWGEGIGTALLDTFEAFWRERGFEVARFGVLTDNEVGMAFYRSRGYDEAGRVETELFGETVRESRFRGPLE